MNNTLILEYDVTQVDKVAKQCVELLKDISVITFTGSLGAGKTTLAAAILKCWGVQGPIISPTFSYVNSYSLTGTKYNKVYHFDLYRLENLNDFWQAGFSEYLYQEKNVCLVEWPDIILPLLTTKVCHIFIEFLGLDRRRLICNIKR